MNKIQTNVIQGKFQNFCEDIYRSYDQQKFLEVIKLYKDFYNTDDYVLNIFKHFNYVAGLTIIAANCCCNIGDFTTAKSIMTNFEENYYIYKRFYYLLMQILRQKDFSTIPRQEAQELSWKINRSLEAFNKHTRMKYYNNIAYVFYKNELYNEAYSYYKKAIAYDSNNIQIIVGLHQAKYYSNTRHYIKRKEKTFVLKDVEKIKTMPSNFDTFMALGKLNYFIENYEEALQYIKIAINILSNDKQKLSKEIYAYDWISRIAYKQKQYSTASIFYEKIIDSLVKDENKIYKDHEEIHPKPELYKMLVFLNETKQMIANDETSKLNKSIWAGIIITSIFGIIQCHYDNNFSFKQCIFLGFIIFLVSCIIIRSNIRFFDYLKKLFPTYYKFFARLFKNFS